jgi:hypothetical protein
MNSTTQASTLASATPVSLSPLTTSHVRASKVLRTNAFSARRRPLHLRALLKPLIQPLAGMEPSHFVLAAARQLSNQLSSPIPERWICKLSAALKCNDSTHAEPLCFDGLPKAAWSEPSLLGEVLVAARDACAVVERRGRADRVSIGSVYTPAALARAIVSELHVGPRRVIDPACGAGVFLLEAFERAYRRRLEGGASPLQAAKAALTHEITGDHRNRHRRRGAGCR